MNNGNKNIKIASPFNINLYIPPHKKEDTPVILGEFCKEKFIINLSSKKIIKGEPDPLVWVVLEDWLEEYSQQLLAMWNTKEYYWISGD